MQLVVATHSPLVLASVEPHFDTDRDQLFHLELHEGQVHLESMPWAAKGDALNWLVSEIFGLQQARSVEAERAINKAQEIMLLDDQHDPEYRNRVKQVHRELQRVLAGHDPFWPRWIVSKEEHVGVCE